MKRMHSDDPNFYDSEGAYMPMGGLGADTTATNSPSWFDNLLQQASQAYATVKNAQKSTAPATVQPGGAPAPAAAGMSTTKILTYTAVGLVALWGISQFMGGRKRR